MIFPEYRQHLLMCIRCACSVCFANSVCLTCCPMIHSHMSHRVAPYAAPHDMLACIHILAVLHTCTCCGEVPPVAMVKRAKCAVDIRSAGTCKAAFAAHEVRAWGGPCSRRAWKCAWRPFSRHVMIRLSYYHHHCSLTSSTIAKVLAPLSTDFYAGERLHGTVLRIRMLVAAS